ncbi:MAG TPA: FKBP-type peptidyl-prolyl cis-trans isomerase [Candidatus Saccharimonadales bacterium]|nr:FKBP-type peptidyl-prolyl cis-trans isomerase [Candidatus Saccharimonadales bacterium]
MATRKRERIIALIIAVLFFGFSFALSFTVIWQLYKNSKESKHVDQTNSTQSTSNSSKGKLEGTKLQDFTPIAKIDHLQADDLTAGTGQEVKSGDTVTVDYTGAVAATGVIFQSSLDSGQPVSFGLNGVIQGWTQGLPGMKVGGTRRLLIPASLAYGANPPSGSGIPANADLVFDVTLHSIGGR